jgi:hypothetical protein
LKECLAGVKFNDVPVESSCEVSAQEVEIAVVFVSVLGGGDAGGIDDL